MQNQLDIVERLLSDLYLVLTRNSYRLELRFQADIKRTSGDLADLMVHGSINEAVNAYGVARKTDDNPKPWYYARRTLRLQTQPMTPKSDEDGS